MKSVLFLIEANLTIPIPMQLSEKEKLFLNFWPNFWNLFYILNILKKKDDRHSFFVSDIMGSENVNR